MTCYELTAVWLAVLAAAVLVTIIATSAILDGAYPGQRDE